MPSTRAQIITRRTYNRPLDAEGKVFETWEQTVGRVISHQAWLWERALPDARYRDLDT
jgi:ribonucleoside-triphosphate reductase (formate)